MKQLLPAAAKLPASAAQRGTLQRKCACESKSGPCEECEARRLQRAPRDAAAPAPSRGGVPGLVQEVVASPGEPLDAGIRAQMESHFGHDFGHVRIHRDSRAAASATEVNALAYTVGRDVVFGSGQFAPARPEGQRLLAHELAHVIQQGNPDTSTEVSGSVQDDAHEHAAEAAAAQSSRARKLTGAGPKTAPGAVQRFTLSPGIGAAPAIDCLFKVADRGVDATYDFLPWYYEKTQQPVPSKTADAFGHCWDACQGSKECGSFPTALLGTLRELAREYTPYGGPHDSFRQDINNQALGRRLAKQRDSDCTQGCREAAIASSGGLDLSAPDDVFWTPDEGWRRPPKPGASK